jgi:hypothetical protein
VDRRRRAAPAGHAARHARPRDAAAARGALRVPGRRGARGRLRRPEERLAIDAYPGLLARDPTAVAAVLWRDHRRDRDDATVVALREGR